MVVEILSPSSCRHDRLIKFNLYQKAGVREYWIVEPEAECVYAFFRDENGYLAPYEVYGRQDVAKVNVLDGCFIELCKVGVFQNDFPSFKRKRSFHKSSFGYFPFKESNARPARTP